MADENKVLGIRLDAEERKRFDEFVNEEGKGNKEFMGTLLNLYELNKGKVKNINLVGDIETLEGYTNKIHQTFINIIDKLESQKGDISESSQKDLQIYKDKVNNLEYELDAIKLVNSARQKELALVNNDMLTLGVQNKTLSESLQDKLTIIEEYKSKNDTLAGILEEYKGYKVENEKLKQSLVDAQANNTLLSDDIKDKSFTISGLNKDMDSLKVNNIKAVEELNSKHITELEQLKKDNQRELERLNKENELNIKLAVAEVKEELNNNLNQEQLKHNKEIETYQSKYKLLLEEIEKVRTIPIPKAKKDTV